MVDPAATHDTRPRIDAALDTRIDAALDSLPFAPLPDGFMARAMARIAAEDAIPVRIAIDDLAPARVATEAAPVSPRSNPTSPSRPSLLGLFTEVRWPAFDVRWPVLDLVLPVFLIVLAGAVVAVSVWSLNAADPLWLARASLRARMAWHAADVGLPRLGLGYGAVLAGSLAFGALATVVAMIGAAALPAMGVGARKAGGGLIARPVR